jgi:hypothetical protein
MTFKLKEIKKEGGPPDMLPTMPVADEIERVLSIGQAAGTSGEQTSHTIAPVWLALIQINSTVRSFSVWTSSLNNDSCCTYAVMYWMAEGS